MIIDIPITLCAVMGTLMHNRMSPLTQMIGTILLIHMVCMVTKTLTIITAPESCMIGILRQTASPNVYLASTTAPPWLS